MSDFPIIPELPEVPRRKDAKANFSAITGTFLASLPGLRQAMNAAGAWMQSAFSSITSMHTEVNEKVGVVDGLVIEAKQQVQLAQGQVQQAQQQVSLAADQVDLAAGQVVAAQQAAQQAQASANFKGAWSALTGAISVPATVYHAGAYWNLLKNLANVAASQPGQTQDWANLNADGITSWQPISAGTTLAVNRHYAVDFSAGAMTLTLPAAPVNNDMVHLYRSAGTAVGSTIARNGKTIMGLAENLTLDAETTNLTLIFNGSTWRIMQ